MPLTRRQRARGASSRASTAASPRLLAAALEFSLPALAGFASTIDFLALVASTKASAGKAGSRAVLQALGANAPTLGRPAVTKRLEMAPHPLRDLIRLVGDVKISDVREAPDGYEVVAEITLKDGSKIVQTGALEFEYFDADYDYSHTEVSMSLTGENRRVSLLSSGSINFWAESGDPGYMPADEMYPEHGDVHPTVEAIENSCTGAVCVKLTMVRERDGKILQLYDGPITLVKKDYIFDGDGEIISLVENARYINPLPIPALDARCDSMGNGYFLKCDVSVFSEECTQLKPGEFGFLGDKIFIQFESGCQDDYIGQETIHHIVDLESLLRLLDYAGEWR